MNGQVYLLLARHPLPDTKADLLMQMKTLLGSVIRGDSLDVPFLNFIKCHSFSHSIGEAAYSYSDRTGEKVKGLNEDQFVGSMLGGSALAYGTLVAGAAAGPVGWAAGGAALGVGGLGLGARAALVNRGARHNAALPGHAWMSDDESGLNDKMPKHKSVVFSKTLDAASPQLSFGCSAQERFPLAVFFFRRKTTFNIGGVVNPHTVIGYKNCTISDWETDGNTETVSLTYEEMGMGAFTQIADSKIPQGISWRTWDRVNNSGGEGMYWGSLLIPLTVGIVAIGGAVLKGVGALTGVGGPQSYFEDKP